MEKHEVEITKEKTVTVRAEDEQEAAEKAKEKHRGHCDEVRVTNVTPFSELGERRTGEAGH